MNGNWLSKAVRFGGRIRFKRVRPRETFRRNESGSVAIEFAFVSVVFFAILFGIITFGFMFGTRIALSYAVAEGGRAAMAGLNTSERQTLATTAINDALNAYSPLVDPGKATITFDTSGTNDSIMKIAIAYSDDRFSSMPFVPSLGDLPPVETTFVVADPSG
ncbi:Flp pilus assembly protein TadG [Parvibaculum indicum]|uniref:TadE/TadG family type IV pilus assembly protein n=1 Tax=Parvibaculum indicum TaxID=562969 RepID=UPI001421B738|nr:TadE/TadG family type IV pilus assembly protein [Parvibaculum indicum]NIJ43226.1 Flp pilus assembly protein TadG [Parvibaculum indicum]